MMTKALTRAFALAVALLALGACGENEHVPQQYFGFKHTSQEFTFRKAEDACEITVMVITTEKSDKDRKATISIQQKMEDDQPWKPSKKTAIQLLDKTITIPAQQKSAKVRLRIFPQRIKQQQTTVYLACKPQDREAHPTYITLKLTAK